MEQGKLLWAVEEINILKLLSISILNFNIFFLVRQNQIILLI